MEAEGNPLGQFDHSNRLPLKILSMEDYDVGGIPFLVVYVGKQPSVVFIRSFMTRYEDRLLKLAMFSLVSLKGLTCLEVMLK